MYPNTIKYNFVFIQVPKIMKVKGRGKERGATALALLFFPVLLQAAVSFIFYQLFLSLLCSSYQGIFVALAFLLSHAKGQQALQTNLSTSLTY